MVLFFFVFFKQKTAYEMRISDWIQRVLFRSRTSRSVGVRRFDDPDLRCLRQRKQVEYSVGRLMPPGRPLPDRFHATDIPTRRDLFVPDFLAAADLWLCLFRHRRSEEHKSELQSLMRISYAVFCLKNKNTYHICN